MYEKCTLGSKLKEIDENVIYLLALLVPQNSVLSYLITIKRRSLTIVLYDKIAHLKLSECLNHDLPRFTIIPAAVSNFT